MKGNILINSMFCLTTMAFAAIFFGCKTAQSSNDLPSQNQTVAKMSPTATPPVEIPQVEIKSDAVSSLEFKTVYKDFYEENSKCRKDYVEYFGKEDGAASSSSPCAVSLIFKRDNSAAIKTIEVRRWDKQARETKVVEKNSWAAKISPEQFDRLAKTTTEDEDFKSWRDGTMINVSNTSISVVYPKGTRTMMMNLVKENVSRVSLFGEFKRLDKEIQWEKTQ